MGKTIGLLGLVLAVTGCERAVVGETYVDQLHGGRALEVTFDSPPNGATGAAHAPDERPDYTWSPSIRDGNDPAIRGMLLASGARFPEPAPVRRVVAPPPPMPLPVAPPVEPTPAPPGAVDGLSQHPVHVGMIAQPAGERPAVHVIAPPGDTPAP